MKTKLLLAEGLFESTIDEISKLFEDRFKNNYKTFYEVFCRSAEIKYGEISRLAADEFIRMVDLIESKLDIYLTSCLYNNKNNKIIFYDAYKQPVAACDCKLGWIAQPIKSKFDLTEDINEESQYQITFPLIITYDTSVETAKSDIQDYYKFEQKCIETYADKVIADLTTNQKYINETLNIYDSEFVYDGYDDNFQIYFILKTKTSELVDEQIIKAIRRYIDTTVDISENTELTTGESVDLLLTAIPVVTSNANISIKKI